VPSTVEEERGDFPLGGKYITGECGRVEYRKGGLKIFSGSSVRGRATAYSDLPTNVPGPHLRG